MTHGDEMAKATATLPLALGGMGLRSADRSRVAAHWASWADTLPMIQERHPAVRADRRTQELDGVGFLDCVGGWVAPRAKRTRTARARCPEVGWQHEAASCVERHCRATPLSRNVHLASPQPNATGHVEIAERPSRNSIFDDPFILFDTVGTCSPPGPSPTSPFPSLPLDQAHLPVWPSTRRLWPPPCSLLTVRSAGEEGLLVGKCSC